MSMEDELRDSLRRRAASVDAQPDLDDVVERAANRDRRTRRLLTAGLVVALVAGPLAGFAIGRGRDDGGSTVATGSGDGFDLAARAGDTAMSSVARGSGAPLEKLFFRTSADGVEIRAYRSGLIAVASPATADCAPESECPTAPECGDNFTYTPQAMITGELSTEAAVTVATGTAGATSGSDPDLAVSSGSWGAFGVEEAAPARWVIASVNESVVRVRATFPGGTTDEMEPVKGVVILASQVADPNAGGATLEGLASDGSVVQRIDITPGFGGMATGSSDVPPSAGGSAESSVILRQESSTSAGGGSSSASASVSSSTGSAGICAPVAVPVPTPEQPLPEPGEQPADPAAARAEIERSFSVAYDGGVSDSAAKIAAVQDGEVVLAVLEAGANGAFADSVKSAKANVIDVVFTSPTEAIVRFDIVTSQSNFKGLTGTAVYVDGSWKVGRATMCRDIALAGVTCPPAK